MKITVIFLIFIYLPILNSIGQTQSSKIDILWGLEGKVKDKEFRNRIRYFVGSDNSGLYVKKHSFQIDGGLFKADHFAILEHYDNQLNETKSVKLDVEYQKEKTYFEFLVQLKDELYLFYTPLKDKKKLIPLLYQSIDKKSLQPRSDPKEVCEINNSVDYKISRDSSKFLIYYHLSNNSRKENKRLGILVFDKNMNQLWEKVVNIPIPENLFSLKGIAVDNIGNVHVLSEIEEETDRDKRKKTHALLLICSDDGSEVKEYIIGPTDKIVHNIQIIFSENQDLICSGLYTEYIYGKETVKKGGIFFTKINVISKDIIANTIIEFGSEGIPKDNDGEDIVLYNPVRSRVIGSEDGGVMMIAEENNTTRNGDWITFYDIKIIKLSPSGVIEWATKIPRYHFFETGDILYSSYALVTRKNKLYFLFNDHINNLGYSGEGEIEGLHLFKLKETIVVFVELDSEGNQTSREFLFSSKEEKIRFLPGFCKQISENEMLMYNMGYKRYRFAKITFKD